MANPFSSTPSNSSVPPPLPVFMPHHNGSDKDEGPERTLLLKQEAFIYKIPPQAISIPHLKLDRE
jgi:hypothetical protein